MNKLIIGLTLIAVSLLGIAHIASATDVVLALKPVAADCKGVLAVVAEMTQDIWQKGNPEAAQVESYLPNVNTPCSYDPGRNVYWVTNRLDSSETANLAALWAVVPKPHALLADLIIMEPVEGVDADGNPTSTMPDWPSWEVTRDTLDMDGNVIGTQTVTRYPGRIL